MNKTAVHDQVITLIMEATHRAPWGEIGKWEAEDLYYFLDKAGLLAYEVDDEDE